jgi:hypothetical protein
MQVEATDLGSAKLFQRFGLEELPSYVLFRNRKVSYIGCPKMGFAYNTSRASVQSSVHALLAENSRAGKALTLRRARQMYRYSGDGSEQDLLAFLSHEYREVHAEDVPPPPSMWSDASEKLLDFWEEYWTTVCFAPLFIVYSMQLCMPFLTCQRSHVTQWLNACVLFRITKGKPFTLAPSCCPCCRGPFPW